MKTCAKCNIEKELTEFHKNSCAKSGVRSRCKLCSNKKIEIVYKDREGFKTCNFCKKEKRVEEFYVRKIKNNQNILYSSCSVCVSIKAKKKREKIKKENEGIIFDENIFRKCSSCEIVKNFKEFPRAKSDKLGISYSCKKCNNEYYFENIEEIKKQKKIYNSSERRKSAVNKNRKDKIRNDLNFRISFNLRCRISSVLKGTKKSAPSAILLGCSVEEAKKYLESLFLPDMNWENYGYYGWHIEHIKPVASFNLTDPEQQKECFHYTNLRPLWMADNFSKGSKLSYEPKNIPPDFVFDSE